MTSLEKVVRRRGLRPFQHYHRHIVAGLEPGGVMALRLEGARKTYRVSLSAVFVTLFQWEADAHRREKEMAKRSSSR
jgi:hypothetical protein